MQGIVRGFWLRLWIIALMLWSGPSVSVARADPDFQAIDAYLTDQMRDSHIPGLAVAIVKRGRIVHVRGFGIAGPDDRAMTPQTPCILGSVSKPITALAIMQLVAAGRIELDALVRHYLPWFSTADPAASERITVRHLLQHTSGFSTVAGRQFVTGTDTSQGTLERSVRSLRDFSLNHSPGEQYEYSNVNYMVLGMIVQEVSGQPFGDYVRTHIFQPLGMHNSFVSLAEAQRAGLATGHRMWFGYPVAVEGLPWSADRLPSGGMISTAEDMAKLLAALTNDGIYENATLLPADRVEELFQPGPLIRGTSHYGLGWVVKDFRGGPAAWHDGSTGDFYSYTLLLRDKGWGVVILTNVNGQLLTRRMSYLGEGVGAMLLEEQPPEVGESWFSWACYGGIAALFVGQALGAIWSLRWLRRYRKSGAAG